MTETPTNRPLLLEMRVIGKSFPGVRALDGVSFDLFPGEIHALVGENGAGKSTLIKILAGVYTEYEGEIYINGTLRHFRSVRDSEKSGVAVVFQELSLVPELSVGENIFLGREPTRFGMIQWEQLYSRASALLSELGLQLDPRTKAGELGVGVQQLVEIAKALSHEARILVLDEPTAALTNVEAEGLFTILKNLCRRGIGIIYVSHRLEEVFRLSRRVTVLRDGRSVGTEPVGQMDEPRVIAKMVGRQVSQLFPAGRRTPREPLLEVRHITAEDQNVRGKRVVNGVSFTVHRGEVLGIAGLMGAGRTELLMSLFGSFPGKVSGEVLINGREVEIKRPSDAIAHGIGFVTEDRKRSGLVLEQSILANVTLASLPRVSGKFLTNELREIAASRPLFDDLRIKAQSLFTIAGTLSGGNQQKVVLAKWLLNQARVLFLDEPTRGIDVGAKQEIYRTIDDLARSGLAVVMVSSELPEVLGLCDRVLVLHQGRVTGEFTRDAATPEAVMSCATGQRAS
ncbi:MAG TPA: sugar ABC transporter ATP-binding protein [Candidatus Angelobacter sp.]|nr:sugar ABC transporter ATP-binding protein [Candidatus Angelobacter sp.]